MHLVVNAVGVKHSGGAVVLLDFLHEALRHSAIEKVSVFCSPRAARNFDLPHSEKCVQLEQPAAERSYFYRAMWSQLLLPRLVDAMSADAFICMVGVGMGKHTLPRTVFIQQSVPFAQEVLKRLNKKQRFRVGMLRFFMRRSSQQADVVVVQTPTMKRWVSTTFDIAERHIVVVKPSPVNPVSTDDCLPLSQMSRVPTGSRLLYVGSDAPHKNLMVLIDGMAHLRRFMPEATLFLTLPLPHPFSKVPGVETIGYLSGCHLWQAYESSDVLVMASLVETVGLPMLEALSVGTPVLAADRPYAHDICSDAALFFDPLSVEDFASQAHTLLTNTILQERIASQGKQMIAELRQEKPYKKMVDIVINPNN